MIHEDNCSGTGKHAHPINRARPALTPPFPLIHHHSSLDLVYLVCLVYLVRLVNPTNQKTGPVLPVIRYTPISYVSHPLKGQDDFFRGKRYPLPRTGAAQQESNPAGCSKRPSSKAAASEEARRRTLRYVEPLSEARTMLAGFFSILLKVSAGTRKEINEFDPRHHRITSI